MSLTCRTMLWSSWEMAAKALFLRNEGERISSSCSKARSIPGQPIHRTALATALRGTKHEKNLDNSKTPRRESAGLQIKSGLGRDNLHARKSGAQG
jgi:hypothetical protein